jgi:hypothetical protein
MYIKENKAETEEQSHITKRQMDSGGEELLYAKTMEQEHCTLHIAVHDVKGDDWCVWVCGGGG